MQTSVVATSWVALDSTGAAVLNRRLRIFRGLGWIFAVTVPVTFLIGMSRTDYPAIVWPAAAGIAAMMLVAFHAGTARLRRDLRSARLDVYTGPVRLRLLHGGDGPDTVSIRAPYSDRKLSLPCTAYVRRLRAAGVSRRGWISCMATVEATPHGRLVLRFVPDGLPAFDAREAKVWR